MQRFEFKNINSNIHIDLSRYSLQVNSFVSISSIKSIRHIAACAISSHLLSHAHTHMHAHIHTHTPAPAVSSINLLPGPVLCGLTQVREGGGRGQRLEECPCLDGGLVNISPWPVGWGGSGGTTPYCLREVSHKKKISDF